MPLKLPLKDNIRRSNLTAIKINVKFFEIGFAVHLLWSLRVNQYRQGGRFIPTSLIEKHNK